MYIISRFKESHLAKDISYILAGVMILVASSKIVIPIEPVPITLQPTAVLLLALTYNARCAFYSVFLWICAGIAYIPVFAGVSSGPLFVFTSATSGYIMSYLVVTTLIPYLRDMVKMESLWVTTVLSLIAFFVTYSIGVLWLSYFIGFESAVTFGVLPFIIPGIIKSILLSCILMTVKRS